MSKPQEKKSKELVVQADQHAITKFDSFQSVDEMLKFASTLIDGKLVPNTLTEPESVVSIIIQGRELGIQAMTALSNIHVIEGKPSLGVHLIMALLRRAGIKYTLTEDCVWVRADGQGSDQIKKAGVKYKDIRTTFVFYEDWNGKILETPVSFHRSEAEKQGLLSKNNWKRMFRIMMRTRCLTIGARLVAPEAIMGMYETSEMIDITESDVELTTDENGVIIINEDTDNKN